MRKLLWVGDAACDSGFAKCTHGVLEVLRRTWEVHVLGINYRGYPHDYPYPIYPCWPGGDAMGVKSLLRVMDAVHPDLVVLQNDPWNIPHYMKEIAKLKTPPPVVGFIAVDGKNSNGKQLNALQMAIFWTEFARAESTLGDLDIPSAVVPLGVDLEVYKPYDRRQARLECSLADEIMDSFIVININRNQPRKRLDLTVEYFAEWVHTRKVDDAMLLLHVCPTGDIGINVDQLAKYYDLKGRVLLSEPGVYKGISEEHVAKLYQMSDALLTTTQGEGWGLTTMEAMACGIPCVVPDWSALGEWAAPAALLVPCPNRCTTWGGPNTVGGVPDKTMTVHYLDQLYRDKALHAKHSKAGIDLCARPEYRWENIGQRFGEELERFTIV